MVTYTLATPPLTQAFAEMSKADVRAYAIWFHQELPKRIVLLREAVRGTSGFHDWEPDNSPESLERLGEWFAEQVELRPRSEDEIEALETSTRSPDYVDNEDLEELTDRTFSLALDIGMYLGQVVLNNVSGTSWDQVVKDRRSVDFGHPVIRGLGPVPLNPVGIVVVLAYGLARGTQSGQRLKEIFDIWAKKKGGVPAKG